MVNIMGEVKEKYAQHAGVEAADKAVASRNDRRCQGEPPAKKGDPKK